MRFDLGTAVIVLAVLVFYLRLIILQREKARRLRQPAPAAVGRAGKAGKKPKAPRPDLGRQLSILSPNRRDWAIAGAGAAAVLAGVVLNLQVLPGPLAAYWWLPVAVGIVAFSWAFR